jgi:hypothetical protein
MKMKQIITILTLILSAPAWAQTGMNPCNRNISTKPELGYAFNDEWISEFPGKTAHFTNTGFTWYPPGFGATITIDKTQNWATPYAAQSGFISMLSPFVDDNQRGTDYLQQGLVELRDWHWEDGWELLWLNLGKYPNGDKIDDPTDANHWLGSGLSWDPTPRESLPPESFRVVKSTKTSFGFFGFSRLKWQTPLQ